MQRLPSLMLVPALAAALALVSGCGGSSGGSSGASTAATGSTSSSSGAGASTSSGGGAGSTSTSGTSTAGGTLGKLLVSTCKKRIQDEPALTSSQKAKLEPLCERAAGGTAAAREVAREVCTEIVKRSALQGSPMTPARKQALEACKNAK